MNDQINNYLSMLYNIMTKGKTISPRGLKCREIEDLQLTINPDYPFMTFKHRHYDVSYFKKEMLWKLGANKYDKSIQNHAALWSQIINPDGTYNSNYGQFFFGPGHNVWDVVTELIRDPDSRKAVIPMLAVSHMAPYVIDTVCTESVGFKIRNNELNCSVHMRSSDVIFGLGTDIPTFAFLYRLVMGLLNSNLIPILGTITITAMSSHIYSRHYEMVTKILENPEYEPFNMPYCSCSEAMKIIASRGRQDILKESGALGRWLIS
jgi:thymidylate synthase